MGASPRRSTQGYEEAGLDPFYVIGTLALKLPSVAMLTGSSFAKVCKRREILWKNCSGLRQAKSLLRKFDQKTSTVARCKVGKTYVQLTGFPRTIVSCGV